MSIKTSVRKLSPKRYSPQNMLGSVNMSANDEMINMDLQTVRDDYQKIEKGYTCKAHFNFILFLLLECNWEDRLEKKLPDIQQKVVHGGNLTTIERVAPVRPTELETRLSSVLQSGA